MIGMKIVKTGNKLDNILKSVRKLDGAYTEVGYFSEQGKHKGKYGDSKYSYSALAQALELGYTNSAVNRGIPMPFMIHIMERSSQKLRGRSAVKNAYKAWGRKLHTDVSPEELLTAVGKLVKGESKEVFNNKSYFPQNKKNETPLWETGDLAKKFAYRTSTNKSVRT